MRSICVFAAMQLILLLSALNAVAAQTQACSRPFPQHVLYASSVVSPPPNADTAVTRAYTVWRRTYMYKLNNEESFVVYNNNKKTPETVSEAHGYGMVIAAYMCNQDDFDSMFRYFKKHPSAGSPNLMAWKQRLVNKKMVNVEGPDSATDGDLDIAYALLIASDQWGNDGPIKYRDEALKVIQDILKFDVNGARNSLKVGDWAVGASSEYTRPSDFMLDHLLAFKAADPLHAAEWQRVYDTTSCIVKTHCDKYSPCLMPDFMKFSAANGGCFEPVVGKWLETANDGKYSYNSCRTPWRLPSAYLVYNKTFLYPYMQNLNSWVRQATNQNPANIKAGYTLDGKPFETYNELAFVAPFTVSAMLDTQNPGWFNALWSSITSKGKPVADYYADSIRLQVLIMATGNWWRVSGAPA